MKYVFGGENTLSEGVSVCLFLGDQRDVFSELSALRRHLRSEQKRLEGHLQQDDWEDMDSPLSDRYMHCSH